MPERDTRLVYIVKVIRPEFPDKVLRTCNVGEDELKDTIMDLFTRYGTEADIEVCCELPS